MYSVSGEVRSAVVDQQIGDDEVTQHQGQVGRSRAGTEAHEQLDTMTLSLYVTRSGRANAAQCEQAVTSIARTSSCWGRLELQRSTLIATCLSSLSPHTVCQ